MGTDMTNQELGGKMASNSRNDVTQTPEMSDSESKDLVEDTESK